jgi:hypothetical protein
MIGRQRFARLNRILAARDGATTQQVGDQPGGFKGLPYISTSFFAVIRGGDCAGSLSGAIILGCYSSRATGKTSMPTLAQPTNHSPKRFVIAQKGEFNIIGSGRG